MRKLLLPLLILLTTTTSYSQISPKPIDPRPVHISVRKAAQLAAAQDSARWLGPALDSCTQENHALAEAATKWQSSSLRDSANYAQQRIATHLVQKALAHKDTVAVNATAQWQKYQAQSTARGWTIAGLFTALITAIGVSLH